MNEIVNDHATPSGFLRRFNGYNHYIPSGLRLNFDRS